MPWRPRIEEESRREIFREVYERSQTDPNFIVMLSLATLIATLGLLTNSAAVIIGAMLISPLMGPILAGGFAYAVGWTQLGFRAVTTIGIGVGTAMIISAVIVYLSPLKENTAEILARTRPNLLDLFIAFFSGLAAAYAMTHKKDSVGTITGVAIATALVPPLCVTGFGLATGQWTIMLGSFYLFVTNLVSIYLSAAMVFWLMGFYSRSEAAATAAEAVPDRSRRRFYYSLGVLVVLSLPLIFTLSSAVREIQTKNETQKILADFFNKADLSRISDWSYQEKGDELIVDVALRTLKVYEPADIEHIQQVLSNTLHRPVKLTVAQVQLYNPKNLQVDKPAGTSIGSILPGEPKPVVAPAATVASGGVASGGVADALKDVLQQAVGDLTDARLWDFQVTFTPQGRPERVLAHLRSDRALTIKELQSVQAKMREKLSIPSVAVTSDRIELAPVAFAGAEIQNQTDWETRLPFISAFLLEQPQPITLVSVPAQSETAVDQGVLAQRAERVKQDLLRHAPALAPRLTVQTGQSLPGGALPSVIIALGAEQSRNR